MKASIGVLLAVSVAVGCGGPPGDSRLRVIREASAVNVTRATAPLSITTHRGADTLRGLRVAGTCKRRQVRLSVGHAPPYEPLRGTGIARVDRMRPPERYVLRGACRDRRFDIRVESVVVRVSEGPVMVRDAAAAGPAHEVKIHNHAIE